MMRRIRFLIIILLTTVSNLVTAQDSQSSIPYSEISTATMMPQCVEWRVTGMCFWMTCTPFGCSFDSSMKVTHWNPDYVVEVKSDVEESPMGYTAATSELFSEVGSEVMSMMGFPNNGLESSSTGSNNSKNSGGNASSNLRFYDAAVVGNPALLQYSTTYGTAFGSIGWCESPATPLQVYYDSLLDAFEWRVGMFEAWNATISFPHLIGPTGIDTYGDLYPRIGATTQPSPYKAASTLAYRAAHIVTSGSGSHATLSTLPPFSTTNHSWPVLPMSNFTTRWSNIKPTPTVSCQTMATNMQHYIEEASIHSEQENYLKMGWSQYTCCYRRGSKLIGGG
ncbi:TraU family protein [Vibrio tubiashii]|uniref:TraU family protein n=1 Tax=Vibrio tubiashii TaxID=29498 RepID=UPI001EFE9090|nr:TraU family protein [Vibrio tubiashii]MCG9576700.1 TraU family protein [Vibrio tubiashii]